MFLPVVVEPVSIMIGSAVSSAMSFLDSLGTLCGWGYGGGVGSESSETNIKTLTAVSKVSMSTLRPRT